MKTLADWTMAVDLTPVKSEIEEAAYKRERQKKGYKTSKQWSNEATNLTGLKGEYAFSLCTGIPVDTKLRKHGDCGADFIYERIAYDIKSTTYKGHNAALLEFPDKKLKPHVYVLVRICDWSAEIIGWATRLQMKNSEQRNFGHGKMLCVMGDEMKELRQNTIPPCVPSTSTNKKTARERSESQLLNTDKILTLPIQQKSAEKNCFPHGPFEKRKSAYSRYDPLYCMKCGRFYGYTREEETLVER